MMKSTDSAVEESLNNAPSSEDMADDYEEVSDAVEDVDPIVLSVMLSALKEHPLTEDMGEPVLIGICCRAIKLGTTGDQKWLQQEVTRIRAANNMETISGALGISEEPIQAKEADKKVMLEIKVSPPAAIVSRDDLEPILVAHLEWINQVVAPGRRIEGGRANLYEADLRGFNLEGVDLRGANLKKVNLSGANLYKANFSTANMENANLAGANLVGAKLKRTNLNGVDLSGANLEGADLRSSSLRGAKYSFDQLVGTLR